MLAHSANTACRFMFLSIALGGRPRQSGGRATGLTLNSILWNDPGVSYSVFEESADRLDLFENQHSS
jgi:hypothetical protein